MKINITNNEYLTHRKILEIASWVLHAHHAAKRPETEKLRKLEQKVFSYAKEMGYSGGSKTPALQLTSFRNLKTTHSGTSSSNAS